MISFEDLAFLEDRKIGDYELLYMGDLREGRFFRRCDEGFQSPLATEKTSKPVSGNDLSLWSIGINGRSKMAARDQSTVGLFSDQHSTTSTTRSIGGNFLYSSSLVSLEPTGCEH